MKIEALRKLAGREEIDYQFLISALQAYSRPRDKISTWLKSGELIRVKKGLYIFGETAAQFPYSPEVIANLIYGPSAISLSYALFFYGLIPERVSLMTSITPKRYKEFSTPIGHFIYHYLNPKKYFAGIEIRKNNLNHPFLIATPEKALCDQLHIVDKHLKPHDLIDMESYLFQDLRIDANILQHFNIRKLAEVCKIYHDEKIECLLQVIKKWKRQHA